MFYCDFEIFHNYDEVKTDRNLIFTLCANVISAPRLTIVAGIILNLNYCVVCLQTVSES
jgi:hypothetical protein